MAMCIHSYLHHQTKYVNRLLPLLSWAILAVFGPDDANLLLPVM